MSGKKGHYGSGTITASGKNSWRIRYRIDGRRYSKHVKGTRIEAARELRNALKAGDDGRHVPPSKLTLGNWITDWLSLKERSLKARTVERYREILKLHVEPALGSVALQKLSARDIDKLYGGVALAPSTAQLLHIILKSCLAGAVKKKLIPTNPAADAEKPAGETEPNEVILDEEQLGQLVKGFKEHSLYPIVATAALTGMRRNELLALRWVDVDLEAATITVSRNVEDTKAHGRRIITPKTKRGFRTFQIDQSLVNLLRMERARALRLVAGIPDGAEVDLSLIGLPDGALCFPAVGVDLTAIRSPDGVTTDFSSRARQLFKGVSLHDLRASHETALLDRGVPIHVVAKRCGHDPATLLRRYARRTKKADAAAADAIGTLMRGVL